MEVLYSVLFLPSYLQNRPKPFILFFLFITKHKLVLTWWRLRAHYVLFAAVTSDSPIPFFTAQDKINSSQDLSENANIQWRWEYPFIISCQGMREQSLAPSEPPHLSALLIMKVRDSEVQVHHLSLNIFSFSEVYPVEVFPVAFPVWRCMHGNFTWNTK